MLNPHAEEAKIKIQNDPDGLKCLQLIKCSGVSVKAVLQWQ